MGAYIARQPNGLLCRFSSVVSCPTHKDMTEQDYINYCMERAKEEAIENLKDPKFIKDFNRVREDFYPANMDIDEFQGWLISVGDTEDFTYEEEPIEDDRNEELEAIEQTLQQAADKCYDEDNFESMSECCQNCWAYMQCSGRENNEYKGDLNAYSELT